MKAYLDTNAFDHLYKKIDCTGEDIANLRKAIYGGRLSIRLSIHNLEEILLGRTVQPQALSAEIRLVLSIASSRTLLKPCDELILDDIRDYASKGATGSPFMHGPQQNAVSSGIAELIETDGEEIDEDFRDVLESTRRQKERFKANVNSSSKANADLTAGAKKACSGCVNFPNYHNAIWQERALRFAEEFAQRAGVLEECRHRGLADLLEIKSVRASLEMAISYTYGLNFEGHAAKIGDSRDLHHVVSAAASADTFVTNDERLRHYASRMKLDSFEVIDLRTFLSRASAPAE